MKRILLTSYSYIAALIGAGFASGQEILCFFVKYGRSGFYGIILSSFIFSLVIFMVLYTCIKTETSSYSRFLKLFTSEKMFLLIRFVSGFFSVTVFSAMLAAADNMGMMLFDTPKGSFSLILSVICIFIFTRKKTAFISANGVAGILITIGIISCTLYMLCYREFHVFSDTIKSVSNSYIYSGYNLVSLIPIIVISSKAIKTRSEAFAVSFISGITMFIMMLMMFAIIAIYFNKINLGDIPMLTLAIRQNTLFSFIYAILLTAAIITTLFASGKAFIETFQLKNNSYIAIFIIVSYALSSIGLAKLVDTGYRFLGICSACIITYIIFKLFKISRIR